MHLSQAPIIPGSKYMKRLIELPIAVKVLRVQNSRGSFGSFTHFLTKYNQRYFIAPWYLQNSKCFPSKSNETQWLRLHWFKIKTTYQVWTRVQKYFNTQHYNCKWQSNSRGQLFWSSNTIYLVHFKLHSHWYFMSVIRDALYVNHRGFMSNCSWWTWSMVDIRSWRTNVYMVNIVLTW